MSRKRGIFRRMFDRIFGAPDKAPVGTTTRRIVEYAPPADEEPIVVYAKAGVYSLRLIPTFRWSSKMMDYDQLVKCADRYHDVARTTLLDRAWTIAPEFHAVDVAEAEAAINRVLAEELCFDDEDEGRLGCTSAVRVLLDPELREHLLPVEKRRLTLNSDHELAMLHASLVEERTQRWLQVIKVLEEIDVLGPDERQLLVPFAASLADKDFAGVMHGLGAHRGELARDLAAVLRNARTDHEHVGLYEFANAYDKALQAFCRRMGLTPFAWVQGIEGGAE
ncbi:hypothetical protein AB0K14_11620 [Actinosynnema sp. NPDC050801]|uniref:hypothetical protein n=1 Tax=unclassified Actinosynnema TaxID=2637065 RepID=UPI0033C27E2E